LHLEKNTIEKPYTESWFYGSINGLGEKTILSPEETFHLRKVLRIQAGRKIIVSNGLGAVHLCDTQLTPNDSLEVIASESLGMDEPPPQLHLILSLLKGKDLEEPIEGLCQLNIRAIHLITTEHTQEFKGQNFEKLVERLRAKSLVGLKQAKKSWLTEIHAPLGLKEWRKHVPHMKVALLHPGVDILPQPKSEPLGIIVGPEGGFSAGELEWFKNQTHYNLGLGNTRIRSIQAPLLACGKLMGLGWL
jgi:16S rRNA (uracil1498-N3)-methyltransferase